MKKNLFDFNLYNSSVKDDSLEGQITCEPCSSECERIKRKINNRKLSEIKKNDIDHVINVFDLKSWFSKSEHNSIVIYPTIDYVHWNKRVKVYLKKINFWFLSSLLVSIFVAIPIVTVFTSFFEDTSNYYQILKDTFLFEYIFNSLILLICVLVLTFLIGTTTAYLVSFY